MLTSTDPRFKPVGYEMILTEYFWVQGNKPGLRAQLLFLGIEGICEGDKLLLMRSVLTLSWRGSISKGWRDDENAVLVHSVGHGEFTGTHSTKILIVKHHVSYKM